MNWNNILDNHEYYNRFMVMSGMRIINNTSVSGYILECTIRKAFRNLTNEMLDYATKKPNQTKWFYDEVRKKLDYKLELAGKEVLTKAAKILEDEGLVECAFYMFIVNISTDDDEDYVNNI